MKRLEDKKIFEYLSEVYNEKGFVCLLFIIIGIIITTPFVILGFGQKIKNMLISKKESLEKQIKENNNQ